MVTRHFIKILFIFIGAIVLGLIGVFLVSYFNEDGAQTSLTNSLSPAGIRN